MSKLVLVVAAIAALTIFAGAVWYYSSWLRRVIRLVKKGGALPKGVEIAFGVVMGIGTLCIFHWFGILLLHLFAFLLLFELVAAVAGRFVGRGSTAGQGDFAEHGVTRREGSKGQGRFAGRRLALVSGAALVCTLAIFGYGLYHIRDVRRTTYQVETEGQMPPMRVLVLADTHYGSVFQKEKLDWLVGEAKTREYDLVLLCGDLTDESTEQGEMEELFAALGRIPSRLGIYYVFGNHDLQKYSQERRYSEETFLTALQQNGIVALRDEVIALGEHFWLAGREDYDQPRAEVNELLGDIPEEDFVLVMDHQPVEYQELAEAGVDLVVSGHTHAGQIFPLGIMIDLLHTADLSYGSRTVTAGNGESRLVGIVTSGVAGWGYPIRTSRVSEYVELELHTR